MGLLHAGVQAGAEGDPGTGRNLTDQGTVTLCLKMAGGAECWSTIAPNVASDELVQDPSRESHQEQQSKG